MNALMAPNGNDIRKIIIGLISKLSMAIEEVFDFDLCEGSKTKQRNILKCR